MTVRLERIVQVHAAFDGRKGLPGQKPGNYGIHGCELRFVLKGEFGAVQFLLFTNWMLPHVQKELRSRGGQSPVLHEPIPADIGYHSPVPMYEGQTSMAECEWLDGRKCYYDGSGLNAERYYKVLVEGGSDALWAAMEGYYGSVFGRKGNNDE